MSESVEVAGIKWTRGEDQCKVACKVTGVDQHYYCMRDKHEGNVHAGILVGSSKVFTFVSSISFPDEQRLIFACGHTNYGTEEDPATVFYDCSVCGLYYCPTCNYDDHKCRGCGEELRHGNREYKEGSPVHNSPGKACWE